MVPVPDFAPSPSLDSSLKIAVPAQRFREGRTGGQKLWKRLIDRWESKGLPVLCEDAYPVPAALRDRPLPLVFWYWATYRRVQAGLIVADQSDAGRLALLLRRARRNPRLRVILVVQHLREAFRYRHPMYVEALRWNETAVLKLAHRIIVHTQREAEHVVSRGIRSEAVVVVPVGVDPVAQRIAVRPLEASEPLRLLWIGGDFQRKGLDALLVAISRCEHPTPTLTVVGQPHRAEIMRRARAEAKALGLGASVRFLGWIEENALADLWISHDVFVQPSLHEGHGSALDEALIRGMPTLASDLPIFRERLGERDVVFVPPSDSAGMAHALNSLRDGSLRSQLAEAALSRARSFPDWNHTLDHYESIIRSELALLRSS